MSGKKPAARTITEIASKGGSARAESLAPGERSAIARKASQARWEKEGKLKNATPSATYGDLTRPLRIGDLHIPCFVLDDQRRVITLKGMLAAMGMKKGAGEGGEGGNRLARFSTGKSIKPYIPDRVRDAIVKPLMFVMPKNGDLAYGYEATILVDLCDAVLNARRDDSLMPHQLHIAAQCEVLVRAFAKTGIVALVDEATGFQLYRAQDALAEILESFISEELRRWVRTFPLAYFREMCRLRNVTFNGDMRFPAYFGHLTNDVIYSRLAPGVLKELKNRTTGEYGRRKKMFQWLTDDVGHPKLLQHLGSVVTLMKLSKTWDEFMDKLNMIRPPYGDHPGLFDDLDD